LPLQMLNDRASAPLSNSSLLPHPSPPKHDDLSNAARCLPTADWRISRSQPLLPPFHEIQITSTTSQHHARSQINNHQSSGRLAYLSLNEPLRPHTELPQTQSVPGISCLMNEADFLCIISGVKSDNRHEKRKSPNKDREQRWRIFKKRY
jgi:hypothetical protein